MQCSDVVLSTNVLSTSLLVELWGAEDRLQGDISQPEASYSSPEIPPGMFQGCGHVRLPFPPAVCFRFLCCVCVCAVGGPQASVSPCGVSVIGSLALLCCPGQSEPASFWGHPDCLQRGVGCAKWEEKKTEKPKNHLLIPSFLLRGGRRCTWSFHGAWRTDGCGVL